MYENSDYLVVILWKSFINISYGNAGELNLTVLSQKKKRKEKKRKTRIDSM